MHTSPFSIIRGETRQLVLAVELRLLLVDEALGLVQPLSNAEELDGGPRPGNHATAFHGDSLSDADTRNETSAIAVDEQNGELVHSALPYLNPFPGCHSRVSALPGRWARGGVGRIVS